MLANTLLLLIAAHNLRVYRVYFKCNDILALLVSLKMSHARDRGHFIDVREAHGHPWEFFVPLALLCNAEFCFAASSSLHWHGILQIKVVWGGLFDSEWKFLLQWADRLSKRSEVHGIPMFALASFTLKRTRRGQRKTNPVYQQDRRCGISQLYITNMFQGANQNYKAHLNHSSMLCTWLNRLHFSSNIGLSQSPWQQRSFDLVFSSSSFPLAALQCKSCVWALLHAKVNSVFVWTLCKLFQQQCLCKRITHTHITHTSSTCIILWICF